MWSNGFHNSVNGDRVYNANHMSGIFDGLITEGIYQSVGNKLAVQPNNGMTIQIATGRGWFNGRWVNNDSPYLITLNASDVVLNRYAAICVRGDNSSGGRKTEPYVKYSDFASSPTKPTMTRTNEIKEYCLAYVYIAAKATAITAANIEDTRQNKSLCGWVTGAVEQITPDTLYTQFTAQFKDWFNNIQDDLDTNTKAVLVGAMPVSLTATLTVAGWSKSGNVYVQTVTVTNMNTTKSVIVCPNNSTVTAYSGAGIRATGQSANSITFTANTLPTTAISVDILHLGH